MARYDDINTGLVAAVGLMSVLAVIGAVIGIQALYQNFAEAETQRKVVAVPAIEASNLLAEQEAKLNRAGWIDRDQGVIAIPIERAMNLVVRELQQRNALDQP